MKGIFRPIFRCEIEGAAETQRVALEHDSKVENDFLKMEENASGYKVKASVRVVDRWLDAVVRIAGSAPVFLVIVGGLLTWALMGIRFGNSDIWIAAISDVQAILCYVFDSLLMRQLLREYAEQSAAMVEVKSRCSSHHRMLARVKARLGPENTQRVAALCSAEPLRPLDHGHRTQTLFAKCIIAVAQMFGHVVTVCLYWVCIFVWLAFGHYCGWSNRWQLYINDATSALMVLVFAFLACLRECYADYTNSCIDAIFRLDSSLEKALRRLSRDELPNATEIIAPPKESYLQVVVFYYADAVGTLVGVIVLVSVIITWASVGPVFQYNNTWWLLIGTYAGLVGLFDSFVLRNVQGKVHNYFSNQAHLVEERDAPLFTTLSMSIPSPGPMEEPTLGRRVSQRMEAISSHLLMVVLGFLVTIGCLSASSSMHWSLTGQLISNVPPSIIETFFMLILITGQNDAEAKDRIDLTDIYYRRQRLLSFVKHSRDVYDREEEAEVTVEVAVAVR
ncbi:hypothetical protein N7530_002190 [Penicillium desertorum]|uniref:Uncharacterized protein n=1 Tax=Penicillium desertorum TaxID=1303715 RepID=A0A9X0BXL5_9EURO|nr:hypothetical protein N7530_002190 [Penicillium desertorum]